ncbi:complement factor H-like isoform X3 [Apostichopus japonicus]|uniref:complement factor H-like isoform X3 n=1 Tax=Stichopus japonicus TaxID=307972 RepID=UPI003AB3EB24
MKYLILFCLSVGAFASISIDPCPCSEDDIGVGQWRVVYNRVSVRRGTRPHGTTATFVCTERGHRTSDTKQCLNGQWRGDAPTCTKIPCVHQNIRNGRVHYSTDNPEQGTTRKVACNAGCRATDMEDSVCDLGSWTTALPECVEISCSKVEIPNGWFVYYDHNNQRTTNPKHGSRLHAVCEPGTHFIDGVVLHTSRCWNGQWDQEVPECIAEPCCEDDIGVGQWRVEYNRVSVERGTRPHGTTATFVCTERGHRTSDRKQCLNGQWRGDPPTCTKIPCAHQNIRNGRVHYSTRNPEQGTTRNVACKAGYRATDMADSVCDLGSWTTALPGCVENPCNEDDIGVGQWRVVYNRVSVERGTRPHGTTATFVCTERGHRTSDTKQCLYGQWRGDAPTCTKIPCAHQNIRNGRVHYSTNNPEQGTTRKVACKAGYRATDMADSVCDLGSWTTALPGCVENPCNEDDIGVGQWRVEYNIVSVERGTIPHGTTATFVCTQRGHRTSDTKQCLNGQWRGDAPTCTKVPCFHQNIRNGRVHYSTRNPEQGTTRKVACKAGYRATDMADSVCDLGSWTTALPECVENPCRPLVNHPHYLAVTYSEESDGSCYPHSTLATFHCVEEGFVLENVNDEQRTCRKGEWSGPNTYPCCTINRCNEDDIGVGQWRVEYNRVSEERGTRPHGATATFVCTERGHRTSDTKQCLNGQWRGDAPTCTKIPCVHQNIRNGRVHYSTRNPEQGTTRKVACKAGYRATDMADSVCDLGSWTTALPACVENPCRPLVNHPHYLAVTYSEESDGSCYPHSTLATFHCVEEGFVLENVNDEQRTCRKGEWSGPNTYPCCTINRCNEDDIGVGQWRVEYNRVSEERGTRPHGTTATFVCTERGHRTSDTKQCLNGQWRGDAPTCTKIPCVHQYIRNGRVHYSTRNPEQGTTRKVACKAGYRATDMADSVCDLGSWTTALPGCVENPCRPLVNHPHYLAVTYSEESDGSCYPHSTLATFHCVEEGFVLENVNDEQRTCRKGEWSGPNTYPCCTINRCNEDDIGVGQWRVEYNRVSVERGTRPHGTTATFVCTERGHRTSDTKQCLNGQWRGDAPTCTKIPCVHQNIRNGRVHYSTDYPEQGTTRNVACKVGYRATEMEDSVCDLGSWTTSLPECVENPCNEDDIGVGQWRVEYNIVSVERGTIPHGTTATFVCTQRGHRTSDTKQCLNGQWRGDAPTCTKVPCVHQNIRNGRVHYSTRNPEQGTTRKVACKAGYRATDMADSVCDLGSWTTALPECVENPCRPLVNHPHYLAVTYSEESDGSCYPHSTLATFHCVEEGFVLENVNDEQRTCRKGEWSGPNTYPCCTINRCNEDDIGVGQWRVEYNRVSVERGTRPHGTTATFVCTQRGHRTSDTKQCLNGQWRGDAPTCTKIPCVHQNIRNGRVHYSTDNPEQGTTRNVACKVGYRATEMEDSVCDLGSWTTALPECVENPCNVDDIGVGQWRVEYNIVSVERGTRPHGATATFVCTQRGHRTSDTKQCLNGQWRGDAPTCTKVPCFHQNIRNGRVHYSTRNPEQGTTRKVACKAGYRATDMADSVCDLGSWTTALPECVETKCLAVSSRDYLRIFYDGSCSIEKKFDPGTELEVTCRDGLFPDRTESCICRKGQWSPSIPRCTSVANCQPVLDEEGRTIIYFDDRSYVHGSNLTVSCDNDDNTVLIGSMTSKCNNGTWNPPVGKCHVNVAKNKRAYQGSCAYRDSGADLAVNGLTVENGRCSQTQRTNQWWFVDLGAKFAVREIQIYHHDNQNALLNAEVRVGQEAGSETNQNTLVGRVTDVSSNPVRITVNGNVEGRFVSVDHTGSSVSLILCEVQIFGDLLGDPCDNGCVVPRSLANGRYSVRRGNVDSTVAPGSCFEDIFFN